MADFSEKVDNEPKPNEEDDDDNSPAPVSDYYNIN